MQSMPLWKRALILLVCAWGVLAAVPNLFYTRVESHNDAVAAIEAAKARQAIKTMTWRLRKRNAGLPAADRARLAVLAAAAALEPMDALAAAATRSGDTDCASALSALLIL